MPTLLLAVLLTVSAPDVEVRTLDGRTLTGSITALDETGLAIKTADGLVELTTAELLALAPKEKPEPPLKRPPVHVEMADGTSLAAAKYGADDGRVTIHFPAKGDTPGESVETTRASIASVRLQEQLDSVTEEWDRILDMEIQTDLLVVRKGDAIDYLKGVIGDVTDEVVHFDLDGDVLPVKRSKVYGLVYYRSKRDDLPVTICRISEAGGSQWSVRSIALGDSPEDGIRWTTPAGVTVTRPIESLTLVDFSGGKVVYLSDLKPASVRWTPYFSTGKNLPVLEKFYAPRSDLNLESKPLSLDGQQYAKGLALRSKTEIVYRLSDRFSRLKAVVGIDDGVRPGGDVHLIIRGDDDVLLDTTVSGTDEARPIELDITGVRRITIVADFGEKMDIADHLDLCEARILK